MLKDIQAMFVTPLYIYYFPRHQELKDMVLSYLQNDEIYSNYSPSSHIKLSSPNLHKEPLFKEHYDFMMDCLDRTMIDLGYSQKQSITSMWATKQEYGQFHHPHKHGNTFLAGVYYLHGNGVQGTSFLNPDNMTMISPNRNRNRQQKLGTQFQTAFVEGDFIVFPAWIIHSTYQNISREPRYILGVNSMPVGKTTNEIFDRYNYINANDLELDMTDDELLQYNPNIRR
jgi:uncharacterized protein (TIGR02466 family)